MTGTRSGCVLSGTAAGNGSTKNCCAKGVLCGLIEWLLLMCR